MINPISNIPKNEYQGPTDKQFKVDTNNEQFSLGAAFEDQDFSNGVIYEPSSANKDEKNATNNSTNNSTKNNSSSVKKQRDTFENSLEKSIKEQKEREKNEKILKASFSGLWNDIKTFFLSIFKNVKQFFGNIWDSKPLTDGIDEIKLTRDTKEDISFNEAESIEDILSADDEVDTNANISVNISTNENDSLENYSSLSSLDKLEKDRDTRIKEALSSGNRDEFRSLISDDGKRIPAHNTTPLTTYNSKGVIVDIDPSDENKILHGNRGVRKL